MNKPTIHQSVTLLLAFCNADRQAWKTRISKAKRKNPKNIKALQVACSACYTLYQLLDQGLVDIQALPTEQKEQIQRLFCLAEEFSQLPDKTI
jgi:hypothetical protein